MSNTRRELQLAREAMLREMAETEARLKAYERFPSEEDAPKIFKFVAKLEVARWRGRPVLEITSDVSTNYGEFTRAAYGGRVIAHTSQVPPTDEVEYIYVAMKVEDVGMYYLTQSPRGANHPPMPWDELIELLIEWKVTELIPLAEREPISVAEGE